MKHKLKDASVRFFMADGIEVFDLLDVAGPKKEEMRLAFVRALARAHAHRDHLAMMNGEPRRRRKRVLIPPDHC